MTRPVIAITAWTRPIDTMIGPARPAHTLGVEYADAVTAAGGAVVLLAPTADPATVLDRVDGLLLSGGGDIDPLRYGGVRSPDETYDPERDAFEIALARRARERRLPTLAICRGVQVVNVAFGGTLVADLGETAHHHPIAEPAARLAARHPVAIDPTSRLAAVYGRTDRTVNTIHHQAVDQVAPGFRIVARAPDGTIEAIEPVDDWPFWGVQWHPEKLTAPPEAAEERELFAALVAAARTPSPPPREDPLHDQAAVPRVRQRPARDRHPSR